MNEEQARALFVLAGIEVQSIHRIENKYWPESYIELRSKSPWWLAQTPVGLIQIGWRKRVISINWENTSVRQVVTADDVTKDDTGVHAWSYIKALEYLTTLRGAFPERASQGERDE